MTGTVKKKIRGLRTDFAGVERWLKDMATKGLMLQDIEERDALFEQTEPQEIEYRVRVSGGVIWPKSERQIMFELAGWELVAWGGGISVYCNRGSEIEELPIDQKETKVRVFSTVFRYFKFGYGLMGLMMSIIKIAFFRGDIIKDVYYTGWIISGSLYIAMTVLIVAMCFYDCRKMKKDKSIPYSKKKNIFIWSLFIIYLILSIVASSFTAVVFSYRAI